MKKFKSKICLYGKVRRCASRSPHTSSFFPVKQPASL